MKLLEYKDPEAITFSKHMYEKWLSNRDWDIMCHDCGARRPKPEESLYCPDCDIFTIAQSGEYIDGCYFVNMHHKNKAFYSNGKK